MSSKNVDGVEIVQAVDQSFTVAGLRPAAEYRDESGNVDGTWLVEKNDKAHVVSEMYEQYANGQSWPSICTYVKAKHKIMANDAALDFLLSDFSVMYKVTGIVDQETLDMCHRTQHIEETRKGGSAGWSKRFAMPDKFDPEKFQELLQYSTRMRQQEDAFGKSEVSNETVKKFIKTIQNKYPEHKLYLLENKTQWLKNEQDDVGPISSLTKNYGRHNGETRVR